ncbi:fimbrillin family protein [Butyricimonas virosa]|uniref:fimbrillin family protein n=1 Tax=Butyricimonas virosa TaxID=544645 RepID=UPI0032BFD364
MKIALLLSYICLSCACVREEKTVINEVPVPLEISMASNSRSEVLPDGTEVGVYIAEDSAEDSEYKYDGAEYKNVRAVIEGGKLKFDQDIMLSSTNANVYVYSPYKAFYNNMQIMRVTTAASPDFLLGKVKGINNQNPNANVELQHMYATVRFKIKKASPSPKPTNILNIVLRNNEGYTNLSSTGKVDIKACTIVPTTPSTHVITISFTPAYTIVDYFPDDESSIEMSVMPTSVSSGEIVVVVSPSPYEKRSYQIPATNWESGKIYTYELSVVIP